MAHTLIYDGPCEKVWSITLAAAGPATEVIAHGFIENDMPVVPRDVRLEIIDGGAYTGTPVLSAVDVVNISVTVAAGWPGIATPAIQVLASIPHSLER